MSSIILLVTSRSFVKIVAFQTLNKNYCFKLNWRKFIARNKKHMTVLTTYLVSFPCVLLCELRSKIYFLHQVFILLMNDFEDYSDHLRNFKYVCHYNCKYI